MSENEMQRAGTQGGALGLAQSRAETGLQSSYVIAKRYPRDLEQAKRDLLDECREVKLAEDAEFEYARGGNDVSGPTIRFAEAAARCYGNLDHGWIEVGRRLGESDLLAFAVDTQRNVRREMAFTVPHKRETQSGSYALRGERDVYENNANMAARRERACILSLMPGSFIDAGLAECRETLVKATKGIPMADRIVTMLAHFERFGVTRKHVEVRLGHPFTPDATSESEYFRLKRVAKSLHEGVGAPSDFFDVAPAAKPASAVPTSLDDLKAQAAAPTTPAPLAASEAPTEKAVTVAVAPSGETTTSPAEPPKKERKKRVPKDPDAGLPPVGPPPAEEPPPADDVVTRKPVDLWSDDSFPEPTKAAPATQAKLPATSGTPPGQVSAEELERNARNRAPDPSPPSVADGGAVFRSELKKKHVWSDARIDGMLMKLDDKLRANVSLSGPEAENWSDLRAEWRARHSGANWERTLPSSVTPAAPPPPASEEAPFAVQVQNETEWPSKRLSQELDRLTQKENADGPLDGDDDARRDVILEEIMRRSKAAKAAAKAKG